jgi:hypothetical protein
LIPQQCLAAAELPADAAGNAAEPGAKGFLRAEGIEAAVGLEQGFDQDILGILAVAADAHHLPVDGVLVASGQLVEVAIRAWCVYPRSFGFRLVSAIHRGRIPPG